ncbi:MAG: cytochrome-c peroxidase [Bacteroidia bacterium]
MKYLPKYWRISVTALLISISFFSCVEAFEPVPALNQQGIEIPKGFPDIQFPEDNTFTKERWELGKKLFYDPILSLDSTKSCNSCHKQQFAFSDNLAFSNGVQNRPGTRNSPSLANVAYHPYYTREGGVPTLEMQILVPIQEHNEFDFNILLAQERLQRIPDYVELSKMAYDREPNYFVITRALATFERSLISGNSAYDKFKFDNQENALTKREKKGMELFFSERIGCGNCHSGINFTNYTFENNGLYEQYTDEGRRRLTGKDEDNGLFKVPSLRNVEFTAPYMHDGSIETLEDVIEHYNEGGEDFENKSRLIKPLNLSEKEKSQLLAFLIALSDYSFINQEEFFKNEN